jgi:tripartite-type tricarboxylate transporter receptor subunit TctC
MQTRKVEWTSKIILIVTLTLFLGIASTSAGAAEKWPTKPIRLICSASAGGVLDTISRGIAPYLSSILGVAVVVENMPGAGTRIANQYVYDAKPDGYTFLFTNNSELTVGEIVHAPRYKTEEFTYIDTYFVEGPALVVKAGSPYSDVKKLISGSKKKAIKFGTIGTGGYYHLQALLMAKAAGMKLTVVPYPGGAPIIADILGGHIEAGYTGLGIGYAMHKDKKLICIAQVSNERAKAYADIPAITEAIPNFEGGPYIMGINAPPGLPEAIGKRMGDAYRQAIGKKEFQEWTKKVKLNINALGPDEFKKRMIETKKRYSPYKPMLKAATK